MEREMPTLYELTKARRELQNKLESLNFEQQTIIDTLEGESQELEAKIEDYGYVIRNMETLVKATEEEAKRIMDLAKSRKKQVEHIKEWLLANMVECGISKIECPAFSISVKNNPPKVVIDSETSIPEKFMIVPPVPAPIPDKKAIAAAIKSGEEISGCHLEQGKRIDIK